jgi:predicted nucleotidyltransferase
MINLAEKHLAIVKLILNQFLPDAEIWVFGSRITSNYKKHSDLDLLVRHAEGLDQKLMFKLMDAFEESDLPIKVDVLDWNSIDADFQEIVAKRYEVLEY